ncbi:F-box protein At3g07870-like [Solanum stenotomum]|uniref:F-box protein At3g07870-like n=1 Tax=Solanum stenotomum TaxID=172797 RepID=UPI0020D17CB3|nr:F-box protein At3g07870-like [Solanum stenotomum]
MEPELFDAPISVSDSRLNWGFVESETKNGTGVFYVPTSVSDSRLSLNCDCRRRRINEVTIMDLPAAIMVEILTKLPINMIFRCKFVCKSWYKLITSDPLFVNMYDARPRKFPCILLSKNYTVCYLLELGADYDYTSQRINRPIILDRNLHLPHPVDLVSEDKANLTLIGSCNGFICLLNGETHVVNHSVCISNPLLGEYFKVKLPEWEKLIRHIHYGFCFSEASGQYKVLRLVTRKFRGRPDVTELEVYTLGVDERNWRNVGKAPKPVRGKLSNATVNGTTHWLDGENFQNRASIYSFNIATEEVKSLTAPSGLKSPSLHLMLAELGNCLCLSDNSSFHYMDIWWMKEYEIAESWTRDLILVVLPGFHGHRFMPIIIWKDGEILMQSELDLQLVSFNPKEQIFRNVVNVYGSGTEATRYIPSFLLAQDCHGGQLSNLKCLSEDLDSLEYFFCLTPSGI